MMIDEIQDIRDIIFESINDKNYTAIITTEKNGLIAGSNYALEKLISMGLHINYLCKDKDNVKTGDLIAKFTGNAKQITMAEEVIIGTMAKTSGIATAASKAVKLGKGKCKIASGAWKKMPNEIKGIVREAIIIGGASPRLFETTFVYLDKNYVRIFGGISEALKATHKLQGYTKVIQIKGETGSIINETREAINSSADVIMVDTGVMQDARDAIEVLKEMNVRGSKQIAFAKGVKVSDIPIYADMGIDLLCIGKEIVDAPLLDMKLDIIHDH